MDHYTSCLDSSFFARGLALHRSLVRNAQPFRWWVLCFDTEVYEAFQLLRLDGVVPIREDELLDDGLMQARSERSRREYYFSCKPRLAQHVFATAPSIERVTYLDGDMYCFSDPASVRDRIEGSSFALSPHRSGRLDWERSFGIYNSGWLSVANDDIGKAALDWWHERCLDRVPDYPVDGLFADQKYLDELPVRFERVTSVMHKGVNLAPWNTSSSGPFVVDGERVVVGGDPLVFFHFHGLARLSSSIYDPGWAPSGEAKVLRTAVYKPYLRELRRTTAVAEGALPRPPSTTAPWGSTRPRPWWWRRGRVAVNLARGAAARRFITTFDRDPEPLRAHDGGPRFARDR